MGFATSQSGGVWFKCDFSFLPSLMPLYLGLCSQ